MRNWEKAIERERQRRFQETLSADSVVSKLGRGYDYVHKGEKGYTSLSKRWEDLYKRAVDYYNNEAYTGFFNTYTGTRNKAGYVSDTGTWYTELEGMRDEANKGVNSLLAELDEYSRYYNADAVSYLRDLIGKRKSSYDDLITDAGKFRDYWNQWATEGDYNNAVWESNFLKLVEDGKYDEAQASISAQMDTFKQTNPEVSFYNNPEAWAKGKKLDEYNKYLQQMRENAEYKPFWDAVESGDFDAAEAFLTEKGNAKREELNDNPYIGLGNAALEIKDTLNSAAAEKFGFEYTPTYDSEEYVPGSVQSYWNTLAEYKQNAEYDAYDAAAGQAEIECLRAFAAREQEIQDELRQVRMAMDSEDAGGEAHWRYLELMNELIQLSAEYRGEPVSGGNQFVREDTVDTNGFPSGNYTDFGSSIPDTSNLVDWGELIREKTAYHEKATSYQSLKKFTDGAVGAQDFETYANIGLAIENPSADTWLLKEKDIGNIVTYSRENADMIRANAAEKADVPGDSKYAQMTEDEVKIYCYYLAKHGKDTAQQYLDLIDADLTQKETDYLNGLNYQFAQKYPVLGSVGSVMTSLGSAAEYVVDAVEYYGDYVMDPYTAQMNKNSLAETTNVIGGAVTDKYDLNILGWDAHDFLYNTVMSGANSLAASAIPGGGAVLGLSAAAQGTNEALERGLSNEQAFITGAMQGIFEGLFESVSIGRFKSLQEAVTKSGKDVALNIAKSMLVNASEEACTEVANILFDTMVNGALANYTWEELENGAWWDAMGQVIESAASGALIGAGFGGIGSAMSYKKFKNQDKTSINLGSPDSYAYDMSTVIQEYLDGVNNAVLEYANECRADRNAPYKRMKISDVGAKQAQDAQNLLGIDFTGYQNTVERSALNHIEKRHGENGTADNTMKDLNDVSRIGYVLENYDTVELTTDADGNEKFSKQFRDKNNNPAPLLKYTKKINGTYYAVIACPDSKYKKLWLVSAYINKNNSQVTQESDVNTPDSTPKTGLASPMAATNSISQNGGNVNSKVSTYFEQSAKLANMGENGVQIMHEVYDGSSDPMKFFEAYNRVYAAGKKGGQARGRDMSFLGENVAKMVYKAGQMDALKAGGKSDATVNTTVLQDEVKRREKSASRSPEFLNEDNVKEAQAKIDAAKSKDGKKKKGTVIFDGDRKKLSGIQKQSLAVLDKLSEALGVTFHIFESENENGKYVYTNANGEKIAAPNGWYDPKTGEIWIDINAGNNGEGVMIFTAAHELTHFIKDWSSAKFKVFADFLIEQYQDHNVSVDELVQRQIDKAAKNNRELSWDEAYEEVIADSCESFLRDSNAVEKIAALKQKDASLAGKIKQFISNMLNRLRELMKGMEPQSAEGKIVSDMTSSLEKLYELWTDALINAGEAYSSVKHNDKTNVAIDSKFSLRGVNEHGIEVYETSEDTKKLPYAERAEMFKNLMVEEYKGRTAKFSRNGHTYYALFESEDIGKNIYGDKRSSPKGWKAKINIGAEGNIFELVENAIYDGSKAEQGKKTTSHRRVVYWDYFIKTVQIDNIVFDLVANVRKKPNDSFVYSIQLNENKNIEASPPRSSLLRASSGVPNASTHSISRDSDNVNNNFAETKEKFSDRDPDAPTNRELLINALETDNMSPSEKGFLTKYKNKLSQIEANEAEISQMKSELADLKRNGKGKSAKSISLENKISALEKQNNVSERLILNLEATKPIRYLLNREREAAYKQAVAEGRDKLAGYREKVKEREKEIRKEYQESRKKSVEGRNKTAMKHKIQRVVAELDTLLRKGNKKSNVKLGLQDAVAAALEAFDINAEKVARYERDMARLDEKIAAATDPIEIEALQALRDKKQRNSEVLADKLLVMKKAYEEIHNNAGDVNYPAHYRAEAKVIGDRISSVLEKVGNVPISEMSLEQLESVYDMYRMVLTTVRDANKAFINGKLEDLSENAADMTAELQKIKKLPEERLRAGDNARGFVWNGLTPYYAFKRIGSKTLMRYYDELVRGLGVYARDLDEATSFAEDLRKKHGSKKWNRNEVKIFKDRDGRDFRLNLGQMMSIYAYSKREQAFDHMEKGGFFFNNKETFRTDKTGILKFVASNESGYKIDAAIFAKIKAALTSEQIAYVDEMQAYLTAMGEKGNEVSRQMWGIDIFKEKVYFPLKSKEDFIYQANTPAETSSLKNDGMTKETKPHASNPIVLESFDEVWANHVNKMSMYHGFVIPIDNLNKLINYGSWIESKKITPEMSDAERYSILKDKVIKNVPKAGALKTGTESGISNWGDIDKLMGKEKRDVIHKIASEFGVFKGYENKDIEISFDFTNNGYRESYGKQKKHFQTFSKLFSVFDSVIENAVGIEVHNRNSGGYKPDPSLKNVYVLMSAFEDSDNIIPVKLEIKEFKDKQNTLYVAVTLEEIKKAEVSKSGSSTGEVAPNSRSANISIARIFEKINTSDQSFLKYVPDGFLSSEQIEAKKQALAKDGVKYSPSSSDDLSGFEMGSHSISTMLEARYSHAVNDYLNTFIKDLNGAKAQNGGLLGWISNGLTKFKKTAVAASLSVVVQQPTAILRAASEIDVKYFAHLPKLETLNKKWEKIKKYAPIAIIKDIGGFDAGSGKQITEWLNADTRQGVTKAMNQLDDLTMYGAALGDRVGWGSIWTAVEREVQVKQKLQYGTEEFWQACGERFTEVIVKTQVYDSTISRSGFMRGKDGLLKMATAFMGESTLSVNMLADAVLQGKRGTMKKRQVVRTVAAVYTATIAASLIKSLIYALRDDDEDESYAEKYLQAFGGTILNDVNPLGMFPIFRDVVSILEGWDVERTDMAIVQDLYNAITALDSENKTTWRKFEDLAGALGALAGVPAKNLLRTAREMYNAINDTFDGIEGGDLGGAFVEGITGKEKSKSQTLYEALIGGEPERIAALRKNYKSDKEYKEAIREALRDYDPRIKKAAQALYEGDLITRNEIMLEIMKEGVFDKETLDRAIDAEMQAIKNAEKAPSEDEGESDWTSVYSPSDIPSAFDYCSDELALEIIAELTDIKVEEKVAAAKAKAEAKGEIFDEDEAREDAEDSVRSTLRSSLTKHYKPLYQAAYASGDRDEMNRIKNVLKTSGLYVFKTKKTIDDVLGEWIEEE